jgi:hypothetical protein
MGRRLTRAERIERNKFRRLIKRIRETKKYYKWKRKCLRRDVKSYPDIPKGVQVHHIKELSKLVKKYNIKTVKEALRCEILWRVDLGITLKRGEHFIFTKLGRYKYITRGFIELLNNWMARCEIDKLDVNQKRKRKKK